MCQKHSGQDDLFPERHYSFPNSSEHKFKLHFPVSSSATTGQTNCPVRLSASWISHKPSIFLPSNQHISPVFCPLFPSNADQNTGFKTAPRGIHQRSHLPELPDTKIASEALGTPLYHQPTAWWRLSSLIC